MTEDQEKELNKRIAENLRQIRHLRRLTQKQLAASAGVSYQQLQKYEKAVDRISGGKFICFSQALNVPVSAFFDGVAQPMLENIAPTDEMESPLLFLAGFYTKALLPVLMTL